MRFPIAAGRYQVTARYDQPRPLSVPPEQRTRIHGGWDIVTDLDEPIRAPESGWLYYHKIWRTPGEKADQWWPEPRQWYQFSNYYQDVYGCCLVLESGQRTYLFCHLEEQRFYQRLLQTHGTSLRATTQRRAYNQWVKAILTLGEPKRVTEGDLIGWVGDEGSSTAPHIHFELHGYRVHSRLDPAMIWGRYVGAD